MRPDRIAAPSNASAVAAVERVTFVEQVDGAETVFVGRVNSSSTKDVRPDQPGDVAIPMRTTKFSADCVFRGDFESGDSIAIAELFGEDHSQLTEDGTYLVFAETRTLVGKYERLVPMGASQGVYAVDTDGVAANEPNGSHDLSEVGSQVRKSDRADA